MVVIIVIKKTTEEKQAWLWLKTDSKLLTLAFTTQSFVPWYIFATKKYLTFLGKTMLVWTNFPLLMLKIQIFLGGILPQILFYKIRQVKMSFLTIGSLSVDPLGSIWSSQVLVQLSFYIAMIFMVCAFRDVDGVSTQLGCHSHLHLTLSF